MTQREDEEEKKHGVIFMVSCIQLTEYIFPQTGSEFEELGGTPR